MGMKPDYSYPPFIYTLFSMFSSFCLTLLLWLAPHTRATCFDCYTAPSIPLDLRTSSSKWTLAQYNVEWLFTEPCSSCPGICTWNDTVDMYSHMGTIRRNLNQLQADTYHLCEVQSCTQLDEVSPSDQYRSYMIQGNDSYTGQNVGLLTKIDPVDSLVRTETRVAYPIPGSQCGYNGTSGSTEGVSKHLITRFLIHNVSVVLIGAHLLSNPTDPEACAKREAQAQVLQYEIVKAVDNGEAVVLLGDLNDFDGIYVDVDGNKPTSCVLDMLKGNAGSEAGKYALYSVAAKISQNVRYTEWYDANGNCEVDRESELSMLDHMLVSKRLFGFIEEVVYVHRYPEGCYTYESDHYPVLVTFGGF